MIANLICTPQNAGVNVRAPTQTSARSGSGAQGNLCLRRPTSRLLTTLSGPRFGQSFRLIQHLMKVGPGRFGPQADVFELGIGDWDALELIPIPLTTTIVEEVTEKAGDFICATVNSLFSGPKASKQRERHGYWSEQDSAPAGDHYGCGPLHRAHDTSTAVVRHPPISEVPNVR